MENIRLRDDLSKVRDNLKSTQKKLDDAIAVSINLLMIGVSTKVQFFGKIMTVFLKN